MVFRLRARNEPGKWTFPGGCVEFGETLEQCAVREAKEEFGIDVSVVRLLGVIDHLIPEERQHWVNPVVEARIVGGEPRIMEPHKMSEFGWFSLLELPKNITSNLEKFFSDAKSGKIKID
jgi:mutator protein MutT